MYGLVSDVNWQFFDFCLAHKIIPFCLPPHSTHLPQPLDVGLFSPLQRHYCNVLDSLMDSGDMGVNKNQFMHYILLPHNTTPAALPHHICRVLVIIMFRLLFQGRQSTYTKANILAAWKAAGI